MKNNKLQKFFETNPFLWSGVGIPFIFFVNIACLPFFKGEDFIYINIVSIPIVAIVVAALMKSKFGKYSIHFCLFGWFLLFLFFTLVIFFGGSIF